MFKQGSNLAVAGLPMKEKKPKVIIMDEECNPISEVPLNIPEDYDFYWGTILGEDNYYYTMVGYDNQAEDPNKTVIKIYKINMAGNVAGTAEIKGRPANMWVDQNMVASIRTPFKSSTGAMKWVDGKLYIHISKHGFASAGVVHQANIAIRLIHLRCCFFWHQWTNQLCFAQLEPEAFADNEGLFTIDHGDAYPRAIILSVFNGSMYNERYISN